jgi:hypothetical protein
MVASEGLMKWAIRFYPPLFLQRIWVVKFHKGFFGVDVKINKSILNKNYNDSIFGGTIFSAADPFYPLLFHQVLNKKGYKIISWSKSADIKFLKPGKTDLHFTVNISAADIAECEHKLGTSGKYEKAYPIDIYDKNGDLCVSVMVEAYVRNLNYTQNLEL